MAPMAEDVVVTRVWKKGVCWNVEGRVLKQGTWRDAAFTALAQDVEHLNRDAFHAFAIRRLPEVTEDVDWMAHV